MKHFFLITAFTLVSGLISGQSKFTISDFEFSSEFEKEIFSNFQNDSNNTNTHLALFLLSDINTNQNEYENVKQSVDAIILEIQKSEKLKKGGEKSVKYIYKTIHDKFFDKYNPQAIFTDIFTKKEYNCATASALYAIIFKELNIPFDVNYSESHVFLIAFPTTTPILVETTNPISGTTVYPKSFIENYVNYLRKSKLISQSEYENKPADIIFNEYFFKTSKGTLTTLTGILYYNQSVFSFEKKDYVKSYEMALRASYFMTDYDKTNFLLLGASGLYFQQDNYSSPSFFRMLGQITAFGNEFISKNEILNSIDNYFRNFAVKGQKELLDNSYRILLNSLKDSSLKKEIMASYHKELTKLYYFKQDYNSAIAQVDSALTFNADDTENQTLWIDLISKVMTSYNSPDEVQLYVDNFIEKHSCLEKNMQAMKLKTSMHLFTALNYYMNSDIVNGEKHLSNFVKKYPSNSNPAINKDIFEKALGEIAIIYYKKGQIKKAKEQAELGLKYFPNSSYLFKIISSLNN